MNREISTVVVWTQTLFASNKPLAGWFLSADGVVIGDAAVLSAAARSAWAEYAASDLVVVELSAEGLVYGSETFRLAVEATAGLFRSFAVAVQPARAAEDLAAWRHALAWLRRAGIDAFALDDGTPGAAQFAGATGMAGTLASVPGSPSAAGAALFADGEALLPARLASRSIVHNSSQRSRSHAAPVRPAPARLITAGMLCAGLLAACASPPKPAEPDGTVRVRVNDPARLSEYQVAAASAERAFEDRTRLAAEVRRLRSEVEQMNAAMRILMLQPTPTETMSNQPPAPPSASPSAPKPTGAFSAPAKQLERLETGALVRVFQAFGVWRFEPSDDVRRVLQEAARSGATFEVRGYTDSEAADAGNRRVATGRVVDARRWLLEQGVKPDSIKVKSFSSGHFLLDNSTAAGRSANRRVEIEIRGVDLASLDAILKKLEA